MRYIPHTKEDIERMLRVIGAQSIDDLFNIIPEIQRLDRPLDLPPALSEPELMAHLCELGASNQPHGDTLVFAGAGCHPHVVPSAVSTLAGRSEFYTAYTPYQPELSQGTLLAIFEFQTMVCELLGMEVANASMYDGASATAEAILMARRLTRRRRAVLASSLHPEYAATCATYLAGMDEGSIATVSWGPSGSVDLDALNAALDDQTAAVVVQSPNFLGVLEDLEPICAAAHDAGALVVAVCTEPLALALARAPGDAGADIAVAEGGGLAGPANLGGPGVGLFASRGKKAMRAMPGRIVGQTVDSGGRPGFVLTLSTREQHIRREKATSNICTNHGLMALRFTINLALLGKTGFVELARLNLAKAAFARRLICELDGFTPAFDAPVFNEFAVRVPGGDAAETVRRAVSRGVVPGVALGQFFRPPARPAGLHFPELADTLLVSVNETHREQDIRRLVKALK
jgi:glycine dehydrogenase subunit 1